MSILFVLETVIRFLRLVRSSEKAQPSKSSVSILFSFAGALHAFSSRVPGSTDYFFDTFLIGKAVKYKNPVIFKYCVHLTATSFLGGRMLKTAGNNKGSS